MAYSLPRQSVTPKNGVSPPYGREVDVKLWLRPRQYRYAPHNDGQHIRRWSHKIIRFLMPKRVSYKYRIRLSGVIGPRGKLKNWNFMCGERNFLGNGDNIEDTCLLESLAMRVYVGSCIKHILRS
jgi:hypothetical protein